MRAIVITEPGGPEVLQLSERPTPQPGPGQIRVRVRASALNRADISQRLGRYPAPPGSPGDIPGLEYAGEVDALGEGARMWIPGQHVMGIVGGGGHAEFVVVHEREAIAIPDNLTFDEAAAIPEAFLTAYDAMFTQLAVAAGETLLIHAVGSGVGTAAVQMASLAGVSTIGTSRSPDKLANARHFGLGAAVNSSDANWAARVVEAAGDKGVNAILDLVGGGYLAGNIEVLAPRGRLIVVGLTSGSRAELDLGVLMRKRLRIMGTVLRARPLEQKISLAGEFAERMLPAFADGRLRPVVDSVHSFEQIRDAHVLLESNRTFGKVVLHWD